MRTSYARFNASWMYKKKIRISRTISSVRNHWTELTFEAVAHPHHHICTECYDWHTDCWITDNIPNVYIYIYGITASQRTISQSCNTLPKPANSTHFRTKWWCCVLSLEIARAALLFDLGAWLHMYFFFISSEATHKSVKKCEHIWWRRGFCLKQVSRAAIYTICIALKRLRCVGPKHMYFLI